VVEKPKAGPTKVVGTKGVMAKISTTDKFSKEAMKAGREMREEGIREMRKGIGEFNTMVNSQVKENLDAAVKFDGGVKEIHAQSQRMAGEMLEKAREIDSRSRKMVEDGIKRFEAGQADFKKAIDAQAKSNAEATTKFNSGAREIRSSMDKASKDFQKAGKEIREDGFKRLQSGLKEFSMGVNSQVRENRDAAAKIGSGAAQLQADIRSFQGDIQRFQEQDLKGYVRNFYYG